MFIFWLPDAKCADLERGVPQEIKINGFQRKLTYKDGFVSWVEDGKVERRQVIDAGTDGKMATFHCADSPDLPPEEHDYTIITPKGVRHITAADLTMNH